MLPVSCASHVTFHPATYTTTDAIYTEGGEDGDRRVLYHYVIAQTMCAVNAEGVRAAAASDDAADLGWFTLSEMKLGKVPMGPKTTKLVEMLEGLVEAGVVKACPPSGGSRVGAESGAGVGRERAPS